MQWFRNMLIHHRLGKVSRMSGFELGADGYIYIYMYMYMYIYNKYITICMVFYIC